MSSNGTLAAAAEGQIPDILGPACAPHRRMDVAGLDPPLYDYITRRLRVPPVLDRLRHATAACGRDAYSAPPSLRRPCPEWPTRAPER